MFLFRCAFTRLHSPVVFGVGFHSQESDQWQIDGSFGINFLVRVIKVRTRVSVGSLYEQDGSVCANLETSCVGMRSALGNIMMQFTHTRVVAFTSFVCRTHEYIFGAISGSKEKWMKNDKHKQHRPRRFIVPICFLYRSMAVILLFSAMICRFGALTRCNCAEVYEVAHASCKGLV